MSTLLNNFREKTQRAGLVRPRPVPPDAPALSATPARATSPPPIPSSRADVDAGPTTAERRPSLASRVGERSETRGSAPLAKPLTPPLAPISPVPRPSPRVATGRRHQVGSHVH